MKSYAGIGSRETPEQILTLMTAVASKLAHTYVLRSGGAIGADRAFEKGAYYKHIFYANDATTKAIEIASQLHPAWNRCSDYARKLHGRNAMILLGQELNEPCEFVLCWTKDGGPTGGTGMGIRIAEKYGIRVRNFFFESEVAIAKAWLNK